MVMLFGEIDCREGLLMAVDQLKVRRGVSCMADVRGRVIMLYVCTGRHMHCSCFCGASTLAHVWAGLVDPCVACMSC